MNDQRFKFWQKWLTYANVLTVGVGLLVAFAGNSIFFELHNDYTREIFFDDSNFSPKVLAMKNWLFGIIGGTIVGFHILMIMISEYAFKDRQRWAFRAIWYGLLTWFFIDSSISFYYRTVHNIVIINLVALLLIGLPLIMTAKAFTKINCEQTVN